MGIIVRLSYFGGEILFSQQIICVGEVVDSKILEIFSITVPVFAMAGIGKFLDIKGIFTAENKKPLSWITYYLALPALIFSSFLKKGGYSIDWLPLFVMSIIPIIMTSLFVFLFIGTRKKNIEKDKWYATIFTSYWGNNGYMGIPLAVSAIGAAHGLPLAAVINGLSVPFYIALSLFMMYKSSADGTDKDKIKDEFLHTLFSPVILSMIFGAMIAFVKPSIPMTIKSMPVLQTIYHTFLATLTHLGHMGLPLALLLVGSNLKIKEISSDKYLLSVTLFAKLILAPLVVVLLTRVLFPNIDDDSFKALVLLNAVPGAVASFIISERFNCAEDFVSSSLVLSTLLSIVTIPLWLHVIL